ncbi:hypothetical protein HZA44_04705, partial [Candidatus Peregrinibacteria bacterium]|nr:hypothetical protein [Candidatus Peregrinibacteria bacterium]
KWVKGVEVKASEVASQTISFEQGSIKVNVVGADNKPLQSKDMCVFPAGETEKEVKCAGIYTDKYEFKLMPGVYDLHLRSAGTSEEKWVKGIALKASEIAAQVVSFDQGTLAVTVSRANGEKAKDNSICVYAPGVTDKELACAGIYTDNHKFILKPGTYDVKVLNYKTKEEQWSKGISVKAAETTNHNIVY